MKHDHQLQQDSNNNCSVPEVVEDGGNVFVLMGRVDILSVNGINPPESNANKLREKIQDSK